MARPEKELYERLGPAGLGRVLADLFDHAKLVRLAQACDLKYPGMRTRTQSRERILADLVGKAAREEAVRKAIFRSLRKETRAAARAWAALGADERGGRLADEAFLLSNGNLGRHLFLVAADGAAHEATDRLPELLRLASGANGNDPAQGPAPAPVPAAAAKSSRETTRLQRKLAEAQKKFQHLETQLGRARETEKKLKKDVIQRKGELAEARMLAERLRRDLAAAEAAAGKAAKAAQAAPPPDESIPKLARAVRRLAGEQKKLADALARMAGEVRGAAAPDPDALVAAVGGALGGPIEELRKDVASLRRDRRRTTQDLSRRLDALSGEVEARMRPLRPAPPARPGEERVGVFVDVQNMYYGARQLKGKLDFDALIQAAAKERRIIQATAYVVESKEIDQSGFIARLEQRAIEVRRKTLQVRADGSMKGDWDMELALDILEAAPLLDVVVLVSGDGDFTSLVKRVKSMGPRVEVIGFPRTTAKSLIEAADHFQPLGRKFMIYARQARQRAASKAGS